MTTPTITPYVKDGVELDQIIVQGIRMMGFHGVYAAEKQTGQLFLADVVAHVNTQAAAGRDELARTVNYSDIADRAAEILGGDSADLLETVAEHIARAILDMPGVECVDVTVHKPQAPLHVEFRDVMVKIRRSRRSSTIDADKRIGSSAGLSGDPFAPRVHVDDPADDPPLQPVTAFIALGGNIGDVDATFREALWELHRVPGIEVRRTSSLFRTRPVGGPEQDDYLNAVVEIRTALAPRELLAACQGVEMVHGRERTVPNGPRTLDLDILAYADLTLAEPDIVVPHPRAADRGFVMQPWATLAPDYVIPGAGRVADVAQAVGPDGVELAQAQWPAARETSAPEA